MAEVSFMLDSLVSSIFILTLIQTTTKDKPGAAGKTSEVPAPPGSKSSRRKCPWCHRWGHSAQECYHKREFPHHFPAYPKVHLLTLLAAQIYEVTRGGSSLFPSGTVLRLLGSQIQCQVASGRGRPRRLSKKIVGKKSDEKK